MIVPCDFVVGLSGGFDGVPGQVVEGDEVTFLIWLVVSNVLFFEI